MRSLITCPRCGTAKYTTKADQVYRCDGCGRECDSASGWCDEQPDDALDSPFYTDPVTRAETTEKTPGVRAKLLAERDAKEDARLASAIPETKPVSPSAPAVDLVPHLAALPARIEAQGRKIERLERIKTQNSESALWENRLLDLELKIKNLEAQFGVTAITIK